MKILSLFFILTLLSSGRYKPAENGVLNSYLVCKFVGVQYKTEFDVVAWARKMYKKHEIKLFKAIGYV